MLLRHLLSLCAILVDMFVRLEVVFNAYRWAEAKVEVDAVRVHFEVKIAFSVAHYCIRE